MPSRNASYVFNTRFCFRGPVKWFHTMKAIKTVGGLFFTCLTIAYLIQFLGEAGGAKTTAHLLAAFAPVGVGATLSLLLFQSALRNPIAKRAH